MFEGLQKVNKNSERSIDHQSIVKVDAAIAATIEQLAATGLNMNRWNTEYEELPDDEEVLKSFHSKLQDFKEKRRDALSAFEFADDVPPEEIEKIRQFDRDVMRAFKDVDNFLGNGATAEVYAMRDNDAICVKFITDQARYNENNHIRVEYERLSHVYESTKEEKVTVPHPIFLRIHAKEGHSYGMEKIQGASLSQILETPEKYPELLALAKNADRAALEKDLVSFLKKMHEGGVTHCDLYKRNIMLDNKGNLRVIDFGKAKTIDFQGWREGEQKSDFYNARHTLGDFFSQLDNLTN